MQKVLLLEPFFSGSHKYWAEGLQQFSKFEVEIDALPGRHWKWRMYNSAITFAERFKKRDDLPDLILANDMLDLPTFLGLISSNKIIPTALYFHENQITYPWSPTDSDVVLKRENQYGFINFKSALAANQIFFNSSYHRQSFFEALPDFLRQFPDNQGVELVGQLKKKSQVLPLGIDLKSLESKENIRKSKVPLLLWNHRWEYDKNPESFFQALFKLKREGYKFEVAVLGKRYKNTPAIFVEAKQRLSQEIVCFGKVKNRVDYANWLGQADILPVTSQQDFFGQSVVEAIYCNCFPILPKRLAYPEHIPTQFHSKFYYENIDDFYQLLKWAIENIELIRGEKLSKFCKAL